MECGIASLAMICAYYGKKISFAYLSKVCIPTHEGTSLQGIKEAGEKLGLESTCGLLTIEDIKKINKPLILHWHQNHFVILYKTSKDGKFFFIADPAKGKIRYNLSHFKHYWISTRQGDNEKGIAMYMATTPSFYCNNDQNDTQHSLKFIYSYIRQYRKYFTQIILGLLVGCILQLIMPFLTQWIVDKGIRYKDIDLIWLILLGELMIVIGRTATDFVRRWLLLHISMRINISLVSDFFIKLLKLPMSFFDTKLMGDLLQRIGDHSRVQNFLTGQVLNVVFTFLSFMIFGVVLFIYNPIIFAIFAVGSICYGVWIASFLRRRKVIDYELFEKQAINQNRTYQFITSMQEIKLQDCEQRRRWEWEDAQADLFSVQMKTLKLQQTQEAGSIFINEVRNILITVFAATAVINGQMTLGAMLAVQYIRDIQLMPRFLKC